MVPLRFLLSAALASVAFASRAEIEVSAATGSYLNTTGVTACGVVPANITTTRGPTNFISLPASFRTTNNPNEDPLCLQEVTVKSVGTDVETTALVIDFHTQDATTIDGSEAELIVMINPELSQALGIADASEQWVDYRQVTVKLDTEASVPAGPTLIVIEETTAVASLYSNKTDVGACGYIPNALKAHNSNVNMPLIALPAEYRTTVNAEYDLASFSKVLVKTSSEKECWCYVVDFTSAETPSGANPKIQLNKKALKTLEIMNASGQFINSTTVTITNQGGVTPVPDHIVHSSLNQKGTEKNKKAEKSLQNKMPNSLSLNKASKASNFEVAESKPLPSKLQQPREEERMRRRIAEEREFEAARNRDAIFVAQFEESLPMEFAVSVDKSFPLKGTHLILSTPNGRISAVFKVTNRHNHSQLMPVPIVVNRECFRLLGISDYYTLVKLCVEWWSAPPESSLPSVGSSAQIASTSSSSSDDYSEYMEYMEYMENCDSRPSSHQSEDALYTKQRYNKKI